MTDFRKTSSFLPLLVFLLPQSAATAAGPQFTYRPAREPDFTFVNLDPVRVTGSDAADGLNHLLHGDGFSTRVPWKTAKKAYLTPSAEQLRRRGNLPSPFDDALDPEGRSVPLNQSHFVEGGTEFINSNCLMCHAGVVGHQVIAGVANKDLNVMEMIADGIRLRRTLVIAEIGLSPVEKEALEGSAANGRTMFGPFFRFSTTIGDNQGPFSSWAYASQIKDPQTSIDDTIAEAETTPNKDLLYSQPHFPTVQPMPWWSIKYKGHHYWYRDSVVDLAHSGADFTINFSSPSFTGPRRPFAERAAITEKILAYAYQIQSPVFPAPLDAAKVERGRALFHGEIPTASGARAPCRGCHGTYEPKKGGGWLVGYPKQTPLKDVGTDTRYNELLRKLAPIAAAMASYEPASGPVPRYAVPEGPGYVPPPLDGVWASAPYFHNGSVPTLEAVLEPDARPEIWAANVDPTAYDYARVGQDAAALSASDVARRRRAMHLAPWDGEKKLAVQRIYDTHEAGKSNGGHLFGKVFDARERSEVIEFLKALGGPDMEPR